MCRACVLLNRRNTHSGAKPILPRQQGNESHAALVQSSAEQAVLQHSTESTCRRARVAITMRRLLIYAVAAVAANASASPETGRSGPPGPPTPPPRTTTSKPPPPRRSPWPSDPAALVMERATPRHWKACFFSALLIGSVRSAVVGCPCGLSKWLSYISVDCESRRARWVSVGIVACFYVLECGRSSTLRYVRDVRDAEKVDGFLKNALDAPPVVTWTASSYHYERGRRTTDSSSRRVVTSVNRDAWSFGAWRDASGGLDALASRWRDACFTGRAARPSLVKIRLRKALVFDDRETERDYHGQLAAFARAHRHRDVHLSVEQSYRLKDWDLDERMLGVRRPLGAPGALWTPGGFWLFAGLGLTVPYRALLERRCAVATLEVVKRVRSRRPEAPASPE